MTDGEGADRPLSPEEKKKRISEGMKKFHRKKKAVQLGVKEHIKARTGSLKQTAAGVLEDLKRERAELDQVIAYLERRG